MTDIVLDSKIYIHTPTTTACLVFSHCQLINLLKQEIVYNSIQKIFI